MARSAISKTPLGQRLTAVRQAIGFSKRKDLARFLKINPETLGGYERGESIPDPDFFSRYKQTWSVNLNWLFTGDGNMFLTAKSPSRSESDIDEDQLAAAIKAVEEGLALIKRRLPPDKKAELIKIAYGMIRDDRDVKNIIRLVSAA